MIIQTVILFVVLVLFVSLLTMTITLGYLEYDLKDAREQLQTFLKQQKQQKQQTSQEQREEVEVLIESNEDITIPTYAHFQDSGMDIRALNDVTIKPQETVIVPTGLKFAIPDGYEIQVRPRSGLSYKTPLRISNSIGTIDAAYKNEVGVIMTNTSPYSYNEPLDITSKGNKKGIYQIKKGDRIAQIVLIKVPKIKFKKVKDVSKTGEDRGGGFGHTGVK